MAYVIEMKDVSNCFGEIVTLRGLSLRVKKDLLGFLGPNGAGKTIAIRILPDLVGLYEGEASIPDCHPRHHMDGPPLPRMAPSSIIDL